MWQALRVPGRTPSAEARTERKGAAKDHVMGRGLMRKLKALDVRLAFGNAGTGSVLSSDLPLYAFDVI